MGKPIDDRFLLRYRMLLDAEDHAFDALEQALSPSEATSPTAATRAVCFFMEVRVALSR